MEAEGLTKRSERRAKRGRGAKLRLSCRPAAPILATAAAIALALPMALALPAASVAASPAATDPALSAASSPAASAAASPAADAEPSGRASAPSATPAQDRPSAWAADEVERAKEYGLIPDDMYDSFLEHMTRAEFCRLAMALYAKITGEPENRSPAPAFEDTSDAAILNAHALGIVRGTGGGLFMPDSAVTRQEMAVMLYNAIGAIDAAIGKNILQANSPYAYALDFRDQASIAPWALQASDALRGNEIMVGDEYRRFNPLNNTTKEMAFILVNRVYLVYSGQDAKKTFPPGYSGDIKMLVKGNFLSAGKYAIIGDVHEYYPSIGISDLDDYLSESPHEINGAQYYLDMAESLNESVFAGYSYELDNGHYAIYVFVRGGLPGGERIYLATGNGRAYSFYADYEGGAPLTQATFSDVTFTVPDRTAVYVYDAGLLAGAGDSGRPGDGGGQAAEPGGGAGSGDGGNSGGSDSRAIGPSASSSGSAAGSGAGAAGQGAAAGAGTGAGTGAGAAVSTVAVAFGANVGAAQNRELAASAASGAGAGGAAAAGGSDAEAGTATPKLTLTYETLRTGYAYLYDAGLWHISLKNGEVAQISIYA
jgi:hypothetical protein